VYAEAATKFEMLAAQAIAKSIFWKLPIGKGIQETDSN
jgi:hypothetical protein